MPRAAIGVAIGMARVCMAQAYRGDTFRAMAVGRILTLCLVCAGATTTAWASPRSDPTLGRAVFTGATTPHATSIGLNPAALGLGTIDQIYVAVTGTLDQLGIALDGVDPMTGAALGPGPRVRDSEGGVGATIA